MCPAEQANKDDSENPADSFIWKCYKAGLEVSLYEADNRVRGRAILDADGKPMQMIPSDARIPASFVALPTCPCHQVSGVLQGRSQRGVWGGTASGKKYMSLKQVVPLRSISAIANFVPS